MSTFSAIKDTSNQHLALTWESTLRQVADDVQYRRRGLRCPAAAPRRLRRSSSQPESGENFRPQSRRRCTRVSMWSLQNGLRTYASGGFCICNWLQRILPGEVSDLTKLSRIYRYDDRCNRKLKFIAEFGEEKLIFFCFKCFFFALIMEKPLFLQQYLVFHLCVLYIHFVFVTVCKK